MNHKSNRLNFTKTEIERLALPVRGWKYYYDTKVSGLAVGVGATGVKTYVLYKKINRVPERIKIGRTCDLTVDEARKQAEKLNGEVAIGANPADAKRLLRDAITFGDMFDRYYEKHSVPTKKTAKEDLTKYKKYLATREFGLDLSKRKLVEISISDLRGIFQKIGIQHPVTANRVLALVSSIFSIAIQDELYTGSNPCRGIKRFKESDRERFVTPDEMPLFVAALNRCGSDVTRDYIWMSLLTGARRSNVLQMRWNEIHFLRREWLIPNTKNGTPQRVPLIGRAIEILTERQKSATGDFVFPGSGKTGHLTEPKRAWKTILRRAGFDDLRLHDLRRTFGAFQAGTGANLSVIGRSLNHKSLATTKIYARLWNAAVHDSIDTAVDAMFVAANAGRDEVLA